MVPVNVVPIDNTITTSQEGVSVAKGKLEKEWLAKYTKQVAFVETHAADNINTACFTVKVATPRLVFSTTPANEAAIVSLKHSKHYRNALKGINGSSDATSLTGISKSRPDGII